MMKFALPLSGMLAMGLSGIAPVFAQSGDVADGFEQRVVRLERLIENQVFKEMSERLEDIQRELAELRGQQEIHEHRIKRLVDRQRELYMDLDRRLAVLERGGAMVEPEPAGPDEATDPGAESSSQASSGQTGSGDASGAGRGPSPADAAVEQAAYEKAFNLLTEGRYEQARREFSQFLADHPQGNHSGNAQYWLAESYYLSRDFDRALQEFQKVFDQYPGNAKVSRAKLKIGFVHFERGDWTAARQALEEVTRQYPGTAPARLAQQRLAEMKKENR